MRILHLSSLYPPHIVGGAEKSVALLSEQLASMGHEVGAACIERERVPKTIQNGVAVYRMAHHNSFWLEDWPGHSRTAKAWQKMRQQWNTQIEAEFDRVLEDFKPDILNTHSMVDVSTLVWRAARRRNVPIVHTLRDYDMICANAAMFRRGANCEHWHLGCRVANLSKLWTSKWVDAVVAVGAHTLQVHVDHGFFHHLPPQRRTVIWNGAVVPETSARAPRSFDRSRQPITFGYLGRINVEKGVGTLIDAFRRIGPGNWQAKIAGQAPDSLDHFRKQAEGLPIEFVGWADPFDFLSELDVLIVPSIWAEPLPRSILEAYAMGVPVIGARSGGIPDLIGAHNEDWLFEPGNEVDLTQKLQQAIRAGRAALPARDAFDSVFQKTRPPRVAEKYLNLYREVLALRAPQIADHLIAGDA